jgi:translation initiation factor IF-2
MAATTTTKGSTYRLFKVAAELNIGKETIVEFLHAKGFDITDKPTSALTQEMYDLVMGKFEKEHRQIEKQRKKVGAYHEKRVKPKDEVPETRDKKGTKKEEEVAEAQSEKPEVEPTPVVEEAPTPAHEEPIHQPIEAAAPVVETPQMSAPAIEPVIQQPAVAPPQAPAVQAEQTPPPAPAPIPTIVPQIDTKEAPVLTAKERADMLEEAKRARREELRAITQRGREVSLRPEPPVHIAPPAPEPVQEPVVQPESQAKAPAENAGDGENRRFVASPPKLQGLTVLGKINVEKPQEKEKDKGGKRKRIRAAAKSVDISAESKARQTSGGAVTPSTTRPAGQTGTGTTGTGTSGTSGAAGAAGRKKLRGRAGRTGVDQEEVSRAIRQTLSRMDDSGGSARQKRSRLKRDIREEREQRRLDELHAQASILHVTEFVTVAELANLMNVDVAAVIAKCIGLGLMVSINQRLDKDTIQLVADEFGYTVEFEQEYTEDVLADLDDETEVLKSRAPIVTIMGHVDHGKTSLLDYIRNANVVAGEAGGITQHIGAYSVKLKDNRKITFLDTPGHEAFTAMRARGAQVTDIVILVVAADDAVMPQTIEAISHAQAANVPMIIAINKVDKPDSNPERIKQQLADRGVLIEEWGGKYQSVELSAKSGMNVDRLLDKILLEAEILDLKANPDRNARGVIIEAEIDKGKGAIATVLVQKGTLKVGDNFIAGQYAGRVRALLDERGNRLTEVGPSEPAQVLGLGGIPTAGDTLIVLDSEQDARDIAQRRQQLRREQEFKQVRHITLDEISDQIARGGMQDLPLIIKGDVDGSVEAVADALLRLSTPEVQVQVIMKSVGEISESDVLLAAASNAIVIGFHVRPNLKARKLAEREGVDIRMYQIIYDAVNEVRAALEGMLRPEQKEVITGTVEVRETFKISKLGTIAGCYVQDGKITRNDKIRLLRDGLEVYTGGIASLRRLKEDVREVEQGFECGISLENMNDIKPGDVIEAYKMIEVKRKLEPAASY